MATNNPQPPPVPPGPAPDLPEGWTEEVSEGRVYFHNARTGTSQWERPTSETVRNAKRAKTSPKPFDLKHVQSIKADESWEDQGKGFDFVGRNQFFSKIQCFLTGDLLSPPTSPEMPTSTSGEPAGFAASPNNGAIKASPHSFEVGDTLINNLATPPPRSLAVLGRADDIKVSRALVYSSVSGTGKTVSMLRLKEKIQELNGHVVIVAYLGFNCCLSLLDEEQQYLAEKNSEGSGTFAASCILARRLAAATIISMSNQREVTRLPTAESVYMGYEIPDVDTSKNMLLDGTKASRESPVYVIAGVDEVQLLNLAFQIGYGETKIGLGRLFLRILRQWQCEWFRDGIRLLPLGTGIEVDWRADPTTGKNIPIWGQDSTLIDKGDFKKLVENVVRGLNQLTFTKRFGDGVQVETVIDLVSALYWPRVRLVEWLKKGEKINNNSDPNAQNWLTWLCYWMLDKKFSCENDRDLVPGKNGENIFALFELAGEAEEFSVIPDGYSLNSMISVLERSLPVTDIYDDLRVIRSMHPKEFVMKTSDQFENLGFSVVAAAIHIGLYALQRWPVRGSLSGVQKKRLGLADWFKSKEAKTHNDGDDPEILKPQVIGRNNSIRSSQNDGAYFPFVDKNQKEFVEQVKTWLTQQGTHRPLYIRCGANTICDYLYFYITCNGECICLIADAKHSRNGETTISTNDQAQLFKAFNCVSAAVSAAKGSTKCCLEHARLLFVTNRGKMAEGTVGSKCYNELKKEREMAHKSLQGLKLEFLNSSNFEFGPLSDILAARR